MFLSATYKNSNTKKRRANIKEHEEFKHILKITNFYELYWKFLIRLGRYKEKQALLLTFPSSDCFATTFDSSCSGTIKW